MKDAYSFHTAKEGPGGLDETYQKMYDAYCAIFSRCGLPYIPVQAESGPIGGDASHEFMVATDAGEDYLVQSEDGSYAANLERAEVMPIGAATEPNRAATVRERSSDAALAPLKEVHTPGFKTIDEVSGFLKCKPEQMIKTIIYVADDQPLIALVRGDHEVNESKLARAAGVKRVTPADPDMIRRVTGAEVGFAGPVSLPPLPRGDQGGSVRIIADQAVSVMTDAVTGANKTDHHLTGVNPGRDFQIAESADVRTAVPGDRASNGSPLMFKKCIEVGHVFKLGTKYSDSMKATCLDEHGKPRPFIMGCYGIGLNRIMAAAIESSHDDKGIIWPMSIAPFHVVICALDTREAAVMATAQKLHDELESAGVEVLLDDRDARPGFKLNDADLIGIPIRVVVGKKGLAEGVVEVHDRKTGETNKVPVHEAVGTAVRIRS